MTSLLAPIEDTPYVGGTANSYITVDVNGLQVTLTGIDGELLTWSSAGVPATVAAGSSGEVLTSNGAGAAPTFQAAGAAAGGSDTEVQYNNGGAFGGMAGVAWDDTANELTITAQAADDVPLAIVPDGSQTADLQTWGTDVAKVNAAGDFSNTQGFAGTEVFGGGSVNTAGTDNTIVGGGSTNTVGNDNTIIGADSTNVSGSNNTLIGAGISLTQSSGVAGSTAIGQGITISSNGFTVAIGYNISVSGVGFGAIAIGAGITVSASGFVIGRNSSATGTDSMVMGDSADGGAAAHTLAIGRFSSATATDCMTIGFNSKGTHADTFLVGAGAISRGVNQIAFGTDKTSSGGSQYTDMYLGAGARMLTGAESGPGTPSDFTIHATDASDTNITGWKLQLQSGISTGNATPSTVVIRGTTAGSTGTTPQTVTDIITFTDANTITLADAVDFVLNATTGTKIGTATTQKLGFFNATPIVQPTEITDELTSITHTAPGSPDFAIQDLIDSGVGNAFGFATKDEGNTVLSVILNLQARVNELETVLSSLGLVADAD